MEVISWSKGLEISLVEPFPPFFTLFIAELASSTCIDLRDRNHHFYHLLYDSCFIVPGWERSYLMEIFDLFIEYFLEFEVLFAGMDTYHYSWDFIESWIVKNNTTSISKFIISSDSSNQFDKSSYKTIFIWTIIPVFPSKKRR